MPRSFAGFGKVSSPLINKPLSLPDNNLLENGMILLIFFLLSFPAHVRSWFMGLGWVGGQQTHPGEQEERF